MLTTADLRRQSENIKGICLKYGITDVRVFGSYARSEQNEASDIDFLARRTHSISLLDLVSLEQELTDILGVKADVFFEKGIDKKGTRYIFQEAIAL